MERKGEENKKEKKKEENKKEKKKEKKAMKREAVFLVHSPSYLLLYFASSRPLAFSSLLLGLLQLFMSSFFSPPPFLFAFYFLLFFCIPPPYLLLLINLLLFCSTPHPLSFPVLSSLSSRRALFGGVMSSLNIASDIMMARLYLRTPGQESFGWFMISMLATCAFMQTVVVCYNHRKSPAYCVYNALLVVTGLKAGADAARVAKRAEKPADQPLSAEEEMIFMKWIEIFAQSTPLCILQCYGE